MLGGSGDGCGTARIESAVTDLLRLPAVPVSVRRPACRMPEDARYATAADAPPWVLSCRDHCPACCGLPLVIPSLWAVRGGVLATAHSCPGCGHGWVTRWDVGAVGGAE